MRFRPLALSYIIGVGVIALVSAAFVYPQISDRLEQAARARGVVEVLRPAVEFVEIISLERGVYNQVFGRQGDGRGREFADWLPSAMRRPTLCSTTRCKASGACRRRCESR